MAVERAPDEIRRLERELEALDAAWRRRPRLALLTLGAIPVYLLAGGTAAMLLVVGVALLVIVQTHLVHRKREALRERIADRTGELLHGGGART